MRNFLARNLFLFGNDIIFYGDGHLRIHLCQRREKHFLEIALEFGLNIRCQNSATLLSIILKIAEFRLLLKSEKITLKVRTKSNVDRFTSLGKTDFSA